MSTTSTNSLEQKLLSFFEEMAEAKEAANNFEADREEFLFHMTDWNEQLSELEQLFNDPNSLTSEQAHDVLRGLLYHMLPHVNRAAEIYDDAPKTYKMLNKKTD